MYTLAGMDLGRILLAPPERRELKRRARKRSLAVELVKRAEVILMLAAGHSYREVRRRLDCSDEYIREWKKRFQEERLAGLDSRYHGSQRRTRTAETEARILEAARASPEALSKREMEVLSWVIQGKRDSEIGVILEISSRTVEKHVGQ